MSAPKIATKKEPEPPLPCPFELPCDCHAVVMGGLEKGFLTGTAKTKFIGSVAAAIFRYKGYPTKEEYDHVGQQTVRLSRHPLALDM